MPFGLRRFIPDVHLRGSNGLGAVLLLGLLVALLFVPYVRDFEKRDDPERNRYEQPFGASTLEGIEYRIYDSYFKWDATPPLRNKVAIIAIDQNSLSDVGLWPWPRAVHARLIRRLKKAGAKVIAFDIDFSSKQFPGSKGQLSPGDKELVAAAEDAGMVISPSLLDRSLSVVGTDQKENYNRAFLLTTPFGEDENGNPGLDETMADLCLNNQPVDSDGGARRYPLAGSINGATVGGFAALACALFQEMSIGDEKSEYETALQQSEWSSLKSGQSPIPTRHVVYAGRDAPSFREFLLRYRSQNSIQSYSYANAVNTSQFDDARMKRLFGGKIVFIGATTPILKDMFVGVGGGLIPGVELHAGAACQLLEGSFIKPPELQNSLINLFGMAWISSLWPQLVQGRTSRIARRSQERWKSRKWLRRFDFRIQDAIWFFLTGTMALLPALCFWAFCQASFYQGETWTVAVYPLLASTISAGLAMVYLFTLETAQRRKVMRQVGLYLDPDIMETILAYPEEEYPRPRRTVATVMFTDLQGFTAYSESHSADDVVTALNAYMSRLQPIVKKHHGSVDKYIGDAIMAYFGVPVPRDDHACCALRCAIEIQEESCRFRADTGIPFYTRIGIHTGELIAGSIGSQSSSGSLIAYTVIGDTVNLTSRLEAKNKEFDSWILCSKVTIDAAPGIVSAEPVRASIRGKSQEVEMFIVRGPAEEEPRDSLWGT